MGKKDTLYIERKKLCTYTYTIIMFGNEEMEKKYLGRKWLIINEEVAYKRIINCANAAELRNIGT
jgi:hypothetical protein